MEVTRSVVLLKLLKLLKRGAVVRDSIRRGVSLTALLSSFIRLRTGLRARVRLGG